MKIVYSKLWVISIFLLWADCALAQSVEIENDKNIPEYIKLELKKIALDAGDTHIKITSKSRSVEKQVNVMLDYYILCKRDECGVELARKTYHPDCNGAISLYDIGRSRNENVAVMAKALKADLVRLGDDRTCMNHVVIPNIKTRLIAIDIAPSSINDRRKFYDAIKKSDKVVRFYYPKINGVPPSLVTDSAFHLEFLRL